MNNVFITAGAQGKPGTTRTLRAGSLMMIYENGSLRHICNGNDELIRMIYMAVRDGAWLTAMPVITNELIQEGEKWFRISYSARYTLGNIDFLADFRLAGTEDCALELSFEGEALNTFEKNRIGFCVLHPVRELAGKTCRIIHPGGKAEEYKFPGMVSPHQPFKDIASMEWQSDTSKCSLKFSGDVFETEDQRNWTDASYKTYSTPLSLPFPVTVEKGWKTSQKIDFTAENQNTTKAASKQIVIEIDENSAKPFPETGICRSTRVHPITDNEKSILKKIRFAHYRTEIYLFEPDWQKKAGLALKEAFDLDYPLTAALFLSAEIHKELDEFTAWLRGKVCRIASVMLFHKDFNHTPAELISIAVPAIKKVLPGAAILCGTNANFASLNRNRPAPGSYDGLCWSVHPQEHASDNLTMSENLDGQGWTVTSARAFNNGELWVSPVTLQRRFNANRENYEMPFHGAGMPPQVDARIMSLYGAGWAAGSLKYLAEAGADAVTYFETAGERGIIQGDFPPLWKNFPSSTGMIFPTYFVFRFISDRQAKHVLMSRSSHPLEVDCLAFRNEVSSSAILINLTPSAKEIVLKGPSPAFRLRRLDSREYNKAAFNSEWLNEKEYVVEKGNRIKIPPYSLTFIDY